jgi:hypothetical protein
MHARITTVICAQSERLSLLSPKAAAAAAASRAHHLRGGVLGGALRQRERVRKRVGLGRGRRRPRLRLRDARLAHPQLLASLLRVIDSQSRSARPQPQQRRRRSSVTLSIQCACPPPSSPRCAHVAGVCWECALSHHHHPDWLSSELASIRSARQAVADQPAARRLRHHCVPPPLPGAAPHPPPRPRPACAPAPPPAPPPAGRHGVRP